MESCEICGAVGGLYEYGPLGRSSQSTWVCERGPCGAALQRIERETEMEEYEREAEALHDDYFGR